MSIVLSWSLRPLRAAARRFELRFVPHPVDAVRKTSLDRMPIGVDRGLLSAERVSVAPKLGLAAIGSPNLALPG
ncbi:MAG: hypothetical protein CME06_13220 [Gemmatimonadetes bacterium]|nr:hypothetical protein [Gemmatimonadota bacterium]